MVGMRMAVEDRRAQLIEAALAVATQDGITATTVRRVAEQAEVALGVVHYAFADKDELVAALAARVVEELADASAAGLAFDAPPDLPTALGSAIAAVWDSIEATPAEQLLTYEITTFALRNPELCGVGRAQYEVSQAAVERLLVLAADAGRARWTRPVPELAGEVLAFLDGVTLRWLVDRDGVAARARLDSFARYLAASSRSSRRRKAGG
jgi:AcrR family transcriptional regulator